MLLIANILAGWLWDAFGPTATFLAGAVFSGFAALIMAIRTKARQSPATDDCVHVPPGVRMPRRSLSGGDIRIFATVGVYMHAGGTNRFPLFWGFSHAGSEVRSEPNECRFEPSPRARGYASL